MPLVPETKIADVGKLISFGNLLVRKITWFVLITTSATLILSRDFGADCMTRIAYIYSRLSRTHSFYFDSQTQHSLSLSLSLSLTFDFQYSTPRKCIHSTSFYFLVQPFQLDLLQPRKQPQKFRQTNERNKINT